MTKYAVHKLKLNLEIKELGNITLYLGIQIEREEDGSYLNQSQKMTEILERFHMQDAKEARTPMEPDYPKNNGAKNLLPNNDYYRRAIGKLLYIATVTRPDIAVAVGILCRKVATPCQCDWNAVKRVMQYLKGTNRMKLRLPASSSPKLIGYVDADWAGDTTDCKSTIFQYGQGTISWSSWKQVTVALSSTEVEFIAAAPYTL
ncbi:secreted RxLR effector protein 161-like [Bufo bufo]|uniref:secreted RxLR effector protein 161-like n=1 Tax=Bufo bufo TaxID=8384 RepID=UPI001ABE3823|nr:secreted RxLR effector protein 161-like [Bufo bufo]